MDLVLGTLETPIVAQVIWKPLIASLAIPCDPRN
jgi:hypothetical protein